LLKDNYKVATLSRGYGRKTKGYLVAGIEPGIKNQESQNSQSPFITPNSPLVTQIGDEPAQFKHKFPDITVAVCEKRVAGINKLLPDHALILMDDAYQHRAVVPGLSILLFDYNRLDDPHLLLPAGNMREPFSGRRRAQIIIVSKCPPKLTVAEQAILTEKINLFPGQKLFFSSIGYEVLQDLRGDPANVIIDRDTTVFLLTGIANARPLEDYLNGLTPDIIHHNYPDHHPFTLKNITKLAAEYSACESQKKIIITTEKDAQRLDESWFKTGPGSINRLPVFVMPIRVEFLNREADGFNKLITEYVREHTAHNGIH
jgi:tetraacyldisaccharide 4'-kinase